MTKVVAFAQARMGSTRFPGKVMKPLAGKPVLQWTIDALKKAHGIDEIVLVTSTLEADDAIAIYCQNHDIKCFRGSEADVLDRFYQANLIYKGDVIVRVTCDCPFLDPNVISEVVRLQGITNADYASNIDPPSYPDGLDVECFTAGALVAAHSEATRPSDRDCVPQFIVRNRHRFPAANLRCPLPGLEKERWVLDTAEDYEFCREVAAYIGRTVSYIEILEILDRYPHLRQINGSGIRNERFFSSINSEELPARTFANSQKLFDRAIKTIPFGAQTFSKSHLQFPEGRSPLYVSHADGARIFDVDGNDYVDLVNAILPVVLGYRDPDVDEAIRRQLDNGISFSLATELEAELSETLCRLIPCAEMVKFGKTGTDVTTAAVRLARAVTGREKVIVGGYHGWADWSMAVSERRLGIPLTVQDLSFPLYEDYSKGGVSWTDIAAFIVEPDSLSRELLQRLRDICTQNGSILIFDEVITGFRWALGGAQEFYGVTPDLACFGKAMGNGMPISAIVGRREIMCRMQPPNNIFYSGTMFGESLSLAAAIATIRKIERGKVIQHLWAKGSVLRAKVKQLIDYYKLDGIVSLSGEAPRIIVKFSHAGSATADEIKTLFMQEMIQHGVLIINSHNISYAMGDNEIARIVSAYDVTLRIIKDAIDKGDIKSRIGKVMKGVAPLRTTA